MRTHALFVSAFMLVAGAAAAQAPQSPSGSGWSRLQLLTALDRRNLPLVVSSAVQCELGARTVWPDFTPDGKNTMRRKTQVEFIQFCINRHLDGTGIRVKYR